MCKKIWEFQVFDELQKDKKVFALDTRDNQIYNLENEKVGEIVNLINLAKKSEDRFFFYYWEDQAEVVE